MSFVNLLTFCTFRYANVAISKTNVIAIYFEIFNSHFRSCAAIREQCKVIYKYDKENDDELDLEVGDMITILDKDLKEKGWWKGELKGKVGVFPDNFVQQLTPEGKTKKIFNRN